MTPSELKRKYENAHPDGLFFSRNNMKFLGDTMSNYGVRDAGTHWELYRKKPVKQGVRNSMYFDKGTSTPRTAPPTKPSILQGANTMKHAHTYTRTTDHSASHIAKVCNTTSLINVMAAVYVFNVEQKPSNYEKGMRYELSLAFSLRIAQYPYLSQMESNIIADYFTAPTIKPRKKAVPYVVTVTYYGQEGTPIKSDPAFFTNQRDALAYAKRKVREAGPGRSAEAYIQRDTAIPYDASYNLESGLTVY